MKPLAPNSLIQNRYLIVHLIGKGGMGEVYLAVDQRLGSAVALKRTFFADDEMLGGAFEREARTLARLRHPVLPKVSDHFTENGEQYLVMEHIAGDDLAKRLEGAQKPFPLSWVLFWADQLLDALAYLHTHEPPIIHRDIKPQNLKLTDENHIVLLDFGLSKNTGQTKISGSSSGSTGSVVGYTPHYAPMEQIRGTGTNPKSDIYSLSATLYQLMSNTVPADALTRADSLLNGSPDPITPLDEINPEVPREVSDVILRGMEVSQEKRFSNAKEMQKTLRKAFSQMQEAMSAQTIAFATPEMPSAKIEQPTSSVNATPVQVLDDADSQATRIRDDSSAPVVPIPSIPSSSAQDATVQYNGPIDGAIRQADVKTEVYNTGSNPLFAPSESEPSSDGVPPSVNNETSDWSALEGHDSVGAAASDATAANLNFGTTPPASPFVADETFSSDAAPSTESFATRLENQPVAEQVQTAPRPVVLASPKKQSKAVWVVAALAFLFFMGIVAAGAGWFVYSNYYASASVAPTPEPTPVMTPTPEPTLEAVTNSNTNTSTSELGVNTNSNANSEVLTVAPTPSPETETATRETSTGTKQTQQVETKKTTPSKANTPVAAKPTPKKSDRTVILQ